MFGRYQVLGVRARGASAEVLDAILESEGGFSRRIALKRLLPEHLGNPELVEAFTHEAKLLARMHHAGIVSVLDFGVIDARPYLALELVDGLDAAAAAHAGGALPEPAALHIATQVAYALDHAHRAQDERGHSLGVVHRDLSPENVLLSWDGDGKIADFGIARSVEQRVRTRVGIAKGKLPFMAPEQLRGDGLDRRTDVFALGCLLHQLLAGRSPFSDEDARRALLADGVSPVDPSIAADLAELLARMLAASPDDRPKSAAEVAEALALALARRAVDGRTSLVRWLSALRPAAVAPRGAPASGSVRASAAPNPPVRLGPASPLSELMNLDGLLEAREPEASHETADDAPAAPAGSTDVASVRVEAGQKSRPRSSAIASGAAHHTVLERSEEVFAVAVTSRDVVAAVPSVRDPSETWPTVHGYVIAGELGAGAFAEVFRARRLVLDRWVALKVLRAGAGATRLARFAREAEALGRLDHPALVKIWDYGTTDDGRPFLAMELVEGRTLASLLSEHGALSESRSLRIVRGIAEGLDAAHDLGFVHRDLSPSNVMVVNGPRGETARILDFGLAVLADPDGATRLTAPGATLGTLRWTAPEQIEDAANVTAAADLYSLGTLLFAMRAGRAPFRGDPAELIEQHRSALAPELPADDPFASLVKRLLAKAPADRPASAREVLDHLDRISVTDSSLEPTPLVGDDDTLPTVTPRSDDSSRDAGGSLPGTSEVAPTWLIVEHSSAPTFRARALRVALWALLASAVVLTFVVLITAPPRAIAPIESPERPAATARPTVSAGIPPVEVAPPPRVVRERASEHHGGPRFAQAAGTSFGSVRSGPPSLERGRAEQGRSERGARMSAGGRDPWVLEPSKSEPDRTRPAREDGRSVERALLAELRRVGLDVAAVEKTAPQSAWAAWKLRDVDPSGARAALPELLAAARAHAADADMLSARLARAREALQARAPDLDAARARALEARYLDLRAALARAGDDGARTEVSRGLHALVRELDGR